jgi:hypothetical protein
MQESDMQTNEAVLHKFIELNIKSVILLGGN